MNEQKYDIAKEAYYESLVKQALEEIMRKEADALLPNEAFAETITLSERHERRMKALFSKYRRNMFFKKTFKAVRKTAAVIIVALGLSFTVLLASPQVRAAVKSFIIEVFEKFTHIGFTNNESSLDNTDWYPAWIPDGFELERESQTNEITRLIYKSGESKIEIKYFIGEHGAYSADSENVELYFTDVDGIEYFTGSTEVSDKANKILWAMENCKFIIESDVDLGTLLEIAMSIKK